MTELEWQARKKDFLNFCAEALAPFGTIKYVKSVNRFKKKRKRKKPSVVKQQVVRFEPGMNDELPTGRQND